MSFLNYLKKILSNNRGEVNVPDAPPADPSAIAANDVTNAGDAVPSWLDVLPEEAAKDPAVLKYKTPDDFYKGYKNLTEMVGKKGVIVPSKDASPEEMEKFYNALGRPEKPEGYKFEPVQNLHKNIQVTPEIQSAYAAVAHKIGLTQAQASELNRYWLDIVNQSSIEEEKRETEAMQKAETALRQEWGQKYDANLAMVKKAVLSEGGQEALDAMGGEEGIGNNPIVLRTLGKIVSKLGEDQFNIPSGSGAEAGSGNETPQEAQTKIAAMMADANHPIHNQGHKDHDAAVAERMRLYKRAYPAEGGF